MTVFTPQEVVALRAYQQVGGMHPFTCPNQGDNDHALKETVLVPTVRGFICPFCDYTQDWAHDWMKSGEMTNGPVV